MTSNDVQITPNPAYEFAQKKGPHYSVIPADFDHRNQLSIETGYFIFTMMPSLKCSLNCPHCYLTKEQRADSTIMSLSNLKLTCMKVDRYFQSLTHLKRKVIIFYWYGGEPTEMGIDYFLSCFQMIQDIFTEEKGYYVRHDVLTSLVNVDEKWFEIFRIWGRGHFQTSFDGLMRGKGYVTKWDKQVRKAVANGLSVSTISVVNREMIKESPEAVLNYLTDLGVSEASFLPFMLNEQNKTLSYEKFAPSMHAYSHFMIELTANWLRMKNDGKAVPEIGQMTYVYSRMELPPRSNVAAQTLFLLPNGDFVLPDYRERYLEFMQPFGNIFASEFRDILNSKNRREYLRKQYLRNGNKECIDCPNQNFCIMEFWKENRENDDCFGAKEYVEFLSDNRTQIARGDSTHLIF